MRFWCTATLREIEIRKNQHYILKITINVPEVKLVGCGVLDFSEKENFKLAVFFITGWIVISEINTLSLISSCN